jgi:hypothetical protein
MIRFNFKRKLKKQIVFFYEDIIEKQLLQIVSKKFKKNNYSVQFSKNFSKKQILVFLHLHPHQLKNIPQNYQ